MEEPNTDSLRALATKWSLAGDDQLLSLLQKTHEKIISKCKDVNAKLDEMASALDDANINLQNVNNKFMALSNSQFIESRVYDDDIELTTETEPKKEISPPVVIDEIKMLKTSLGILEQAFETAEIIDESDSDSDAEISVVLKPKDMYADRPLPYIIGSQQWKNKWHAGLIVEDSDSDSSTSKRDRDVDQYSDSDSEEITRPPLEDNTLSESGSSFGGSAGTSVRGAGAPPPAPGAPAKPADIAAALAQRLNLHAETVTQKEPEDIAPSQPDKIVRKLYKPEVPPTSTIFSDEPPPLDVVDTQSSDDDIFAEINKNTPYTQKKPVPSNVTEDLFSFDKPALEEGDIFSDFAPKNTYSKPARPKPALFEDEPDPESFVDPSRTEDIRNNTDTVEPSSKKPVGGISLFGSNQGTESIGAAILKRNVRKSSTSDDDSESDVLTIRNDNNSTIEENKSKFTLKNNVLPETKIVNDTSDEIDNKLKTRKEKDIFNDLFSKPENIDKKPSKVVKEKINNNVATPVKSRVEDKPKTNVKDLFSDNLFDDIDDIFTNNVKIPNNTKSKDTNEKSIKKSLFDDEDLFTDINVETNTNSLPIAKVDNDDGLFSDVKVAGDAPKATTIFAPNNQTIEETKQQTDARNETNIFVNSQKTPVHKSENKVKSIFDSDSEGDDSIFSFGHSNKTTNSYATTRNIKTTVSNNEENNTSQYKNLLTTDNLVSKNKDVIQSPSLFEEDEIDDLFIESSKLNSGQNDNTNISNVENDISNAKDATDDIKFVMEKESVITVESTVKTKIDETKHPIQKHNADESGQRDVCIISDKKSVDVLSTVPEMAPMNDKSHKISDEFVDSSQNTSENEPLKIDSRTLFTGSRFEKVTDGSEPNSVNPSKSDNFVDTSTEYKTSDSKAPILNSDFNDIFAEPPEFQKPAEPKKSKNINALFDDDSDDESLFFKKNDIISDEKPEMFTRNANFGIFVDEPPAIDVDFTTKSSKNVHGELFYTDANAENILPTTKIIHDEEIVSPKSNKPENKNEIQSENIKPDNNQSLSKESDVKKIGKLNTKNLSINVNALLPGASPKKVAKQNNDYTSTIEPEETKIIPEETDIKSVHTINKLESDQETVIKDKSIVFDDNSKSDVLDNKASKQRPRIQVKRRPSSRKARHEAVRKSVLNLEEDSENSSSFDEPRSPRSPTGSQNVLRNEEDTQNKPSIIPQNTDPVYSSCNTNSAMETAAITESHKSTTQPNTNEKESNKNTITNLSISAQDSNLNSNENKATTKVVYILNDEDIFNTNSEHPENSLFETRKDAESKVESKKILFENDDDEDLFRSTEGVKTLGKSYAQNKDIRKTEDVTMKLDSQDNKTEKKLQAQRKDVPLQKEKQSLFDDSDEELFGKKSKVIKKTTIFDSDSEEELFSGKKNKEKSNKEQRIRDVQEKKPSLKTSLFSDDDDDDLFGIKKDRKSESKLTPSTSKEMSSSTISSKTAEPVFSDPLSMLGDD